MKLSKISYTSAVFFWATALVFFFLYGWMLWSMREAILMQSGAEITIGMAFVWLPLVGSLMVYAMTTVAIFIYNLVARKYPISWEVKK